MTPVSFNLIVTKSLTGLKPSAQPPLRGPHECPLSFPWVLTNKSLLFHFPQTLSYPFLSLSPQPPRSFSTGVNYEAPHPSFIRGQRNSSNPALRGPPAMFRTLIHILLREEMSPTHSLSSKQCPHPKLNGSHLCLHSPTRLNYCSILRSVAES